MLNFLLFVKNNVKLLKGLLPDKVFLNFISLFVLFITIALAFKLPIEILQLIYSEPI